MLMVAAVRTRKRPSLWKPIQCLERQARGKYSPNVSPDAADESLYCAPAADAADYDYAEMSFRWFVIL